MGTKARFFLRLDKRQKEISVIDLTCLSLWLFYYSCQCRWYIPIWERSYHHDDRFFLLAHVVGFVYSLWRFDHILKWHTLTRCSDFCFCRIVHVFTGWLKNVPKLLQSFHFQSTFNIWMIYTFRPLLVAKEYGMWVVKWLRFRKSYLSNGGNWQYIHTLES